MKDDDDSSPSALDINETDDLVSSTSSSSNNHDDDRNRKHQNRKKHKKEKRTKSHDRHRRKHHKTNKKEKKSKEKKRKKEDRKRKHNDDDDSSVDSSSSHSVDSRGKKKRKKEHKRRRKEGKKSCRNDDDDEQEVPGEIIPSRNQMVAEALHNLLMTKPEFASELPIILIRLAGGATFDLRQVTDSMVSTGLQSIFRSLGSFGVKQDDNGMWMFQAPPGAARRDELVLLRVVRSLLDDVGLTIRTIESFESQKQVESSNSSKKEQDSEPYRKGTKTQEIGETEDKQMKELTLKLLTRFWSKDTELASQLSSLCQTIATGESVSIDGIPDESLKGALESLFDACGLEKSEMENDDSDDDQDDGDDKNDDYPLMGYGIPDIADDSVHIKLASIMAACREGPPKRKVVGPMRRPTTEEEEKAANVLYSSNQTNDKDTVDEEEDDGPLMPGAARRAPALPAEMIKAQAEYRELQLKATVAGVPMPTGGGREEWMIVPGKYDFLSNVKSGQPIKSRGFQNKKSRDSEAPAAPVHPAIQAEMDAIMQAHQQARGPSLFDQHRAKKQKEKELSAAAGGKTEWKWSRDNDLDAGRRVDKDALGMILGGASANLKTKFQGGFNR